MVYLLRLRSGDIGALATLPLEHALVAHKKLDTAWSSMIFCQSLLLPEDSPNEKNAETEHE